MIRIVPPITDNPELDQFNLELVQHITGTPPVPVFDQRTGIITSLIDGSVVGYLKRYIHVKYADDNIGTNFSNLPTNRMYYGFLNTDDTMESEEYKDYTWYPVDDPGFGASNKLWFRNLGGRSIDLFVGVLPPSYKWNEAPLSAIDLDDLIGNGAVSTDQLADGAVTTPKLANNSVTEPKIADAAVTTSKHADLSVTTPKLADASVSTPKLANSAVTVEKLASTGTPAVDTFLNGNMEWVPLDTGPTGLFLEQHEILVNEYIEAAWSGWQLYHPRSLDYQAIVSVPNPAVLDFPIGTTFVIINMKNDVILRCDTGTIVLEGTGDEGTAFLIGEFGKGTLTKIEADLWFLDGSNITLTTDPGPEIGEGDFMFLGVAEGEGVDFDFLG